MARRVCVVDDVDAADERDASVDRAQLAMEPSKAMRTELPRRNFRPVLEQRDTCSDELRFERASQVMSGAPAVDQDPHFRTALRGAAKRRRDDATGVVVGEDVGFKPDFALGAVDCADDGREVAAAAQERDAVPGHEAVHRGRRDVSNLAASAA